MGGEGSMAQANQSLKLNRGQLKRRSFKDLKSLMMSQSGKTTLEFQQIAPEELSRIKNEIRFRAKKEQKKLILIYIISLIITITLIGITFQFA